MKLKFNPLSGVFDMIGEDGMSYVVEVANFAALPVTGLSGVIYVTLNDGVLYRWGGTQYAEVSASLALGETASTAYRGDRGKTAYDHSQITAADPHGSVTDQRVADLTTNAPAATPVDADVFPLVVDGGQRKTTWAVIKSTLKTYFDTIYQPKSAGWVAWTPTFTNLTIGNGIVTAFYTIDAVTKLCNYKIVVTLGTTSVMGSSPRFTLPFNLHSTYVVPDTVGRGNSITAAGSPARSAALFHSANQVTILTVSSAYADITATAPFIWATGARISIDGSYRTA